MQPLIVGLRFQQVGKVYHFDASDCRDLQIGDFAIVDTNRGQQLGEVVCMVESPDPPPEGKWKRVYRRATPRDLALRQIWKQKEIEALINCRAKVAEIGLEGIKIVGAEFSIDGERLTYLFSSEAEEKVDLKKLRIAIKRVYPRAHLEIHPIGPRDVAKMMGGMGACGLENRCCSMFLNEFSPISIKMAKEQGISLTPSEITGMCGRLRCCLVYEYEQYIEANKQLPKRGKRVITPLGEGKVVDLYPLQQSILVELDSGSKHEFIKEEIQPWDELEALKKKTEEPCNKNSGGGLCGNDNTI